MIRRSSVFTGAALSLAMILAACSGGDDPTPTPSPTPTPTPTGTPTPTPVSYSTFPLTAATEFGSINAYTSFTGDPSGAGTLELGTAGVEGPSTRFRLAALADPTAATTTTAQVVRENTEETRFVAADLTAGTPPATGVTEYAFVQNGTTAGQTARAEFLNNTVTGKVTTDTGLALVQTSYAGYLRADSTAGAHRITYGVWGYPTVATDLPTTGTATYTARVAGRAVTGGAGGTVTRVGGTVTITVNWVTGSVGITANVTTVGAGGVETPFGTYTGTGALPVGTVNFAGNFGAASPIPGNLGGAFFGPQGAEIGLSFAGSGTIGGIDTRLVGVMVGKKNP